MTLISSASFALPSRIGVSQPTFSAPAGARAGRAAVGAEPPTRATLGQREDGSVVYRNPRTPSSSPRLWSSPPQGDDAVSALMARNRGMNSYQLADQWRSLGGALLTRFGQTGENYSQALVDDRTVDAAMALAALPPDEQSQRLADVTAMQAADLANVGNEAPTANLKIKTRSGQSVELKISVDAGFNGLVGMKVELKASGATSPAERRAVEQLSDGLDRVLEGLGRDDAVALDLSGLMDYDRDAIASIDLKVDNTQTHQVLRAFSLHLGDEKQSLTLKGSDGEIDLNVDKGMSAIDTMPAPQRRAALEGMLERMDSAGERGHANRALLQQMKSAFKHFQMGAIQDRSDGRDTVTSQPGALAPTSTDLAPARTGLADFSASFRGETVRRNRFGSAHEAGQIEYELNQKTTGKDGRHGGNRQAQTVSERLAADFKKAAQPDAMLDVRTGNYSATQIRDSSTLTTLIDAAASGVARVLRKTDLQQLKTVVALENHQVVNRQSWPFEHKGIERLH